MALPNHLARAYRASRYTVAGLTLSIGRKSGALDGLLAGLGVREAMLITAWNPASRRMPRGWNTRMMAALRDRLGSTPAFPARGTGHDWSEDHLLVTGDKRRLAVLARLFGQSAMVACRRGRDVQLVSLI